jgi:cell pole-organizing protein PopZ
MAGLTDPEAETFEAADTVADEELANPENEALEAVSESETVASDDTDNIMDDILDMSMDDELSTHSDDVEGDLEALLEIPSPDNTSSISVTAEQVAQDEALNITENVEAQEVEAQEVEAQEVEAQEVEAQESNVEAQEAEVQQTNVQENELEAEVEIEAQEVETQDHDASEGLSLYDIAAEAERDAVVMEQQGEIQSSVDAVIELDAVPTDVEEDLESAPKPIFDLNRGLAALGLTSLGASLGVGAVMASGKSEAEETELNEEQDFDVQERDEGGETQTETENLEKESADMASATAQKDVILDDVTEAASAGAFASLSKMVEEEAITAERGDRIGDLVMEALRPMLKEWLDANLKGIVERAVQKEVKRIASGK